MNASAVSSVGATILDLKVNEKKSLNLKIDPLILKASLDKNHIFDVSTQFNFPFGKIETSIKDKDYVLIFSPKLNGPNVNIIFPRRNIYHIDLTMDQLIQFKGQNYLFHAECINNKSLLSVETKREFNFKNLSGIFSFKYGDSIDIGLKAALPYINSSFSVDKNFIRFCGAIGKPSLFGMYKLKNNYTENFHKFGVFTKYNAAKLSTLYDLKKKCCTVKVQNRVIPPLLVAFSFSTIQNKLSDYICGFSYENRNLYGLDNSKYHLKWNLPYEIVARLEASYINGTSDVTLSYNYKSNEFHIGFEQTIEFNKSKEMNI